MSIEIIRGRLEQDTTLHKRTKLSVDDIVKLLQFILTTTYFKANDCIYRQKFGAAMGSPVAPIVCNLYMEFFEQQALATVPLPAKPKLWKRYVDDTLEAVKKDQVDILTNHLNSTDKTGSIKVTVEKEVDGRLPVLDALIIRRADGDVKLLVYRKKTHTDQYLNFKSHHPLHHKMGVV